MSTVPTGRPRMADTQSLVFWVCAVAVVYSGFQMYHEITSSATLQAVPAVGWMALVVWGGYGIALFALVYRHQLFLRRSPWITAAALAWGGTVALWFAVKANTAMEDIFDHWFSTGFRDDWGMALAAASNEESLKALGVIALALLPLTRIRTTLDGLYYGLMVGLGFQVMEDYLYTSNQSADLGGVIGFLVQRGLFAGLWAHAVYTGIVGVGIGYFVSRKDVKAARRAAVAAGLFAVAWTFHFLWDAGPVNDIFGDGDGAFFAIIAMKGIPALAVLLVLLRWAQRHERTQWTGFVEAHVGDEIIAADELPTLLSRKARKQAMKATRAASGLRAGRVRKHLQHAQLAYVQAVMEEGAGSTAATEAGDKVTLLRTAL